MPTSRRTASPRRAAPRHEPEGARRAPRRVAALLALAPLAVAVATNGCGAAAPAPEPASGAQAEAPAAPSQVGYGAPGDDSGAETLAEAFVRLDQAERQVEAALGVGPGQLGGATPALVTPEPAGDPTRPRAETPLSQGPSSTERCDVACDAFASMQRAAHRLCDLAGDDDPRCLRAGERLERARSLVRSSCPSCQP